MAKLISFKITSVFCFIFCAWVGAAIAENTRLICILDGTGSSYVDGVKADDGSQVKLQKDYSFSSDDKKVISVDETWLLSGDDHFEQTTWQNDAFYIETSVTDAKITYKRRGIKGAELASNATLHAYLWSEEINRFSGLIVIDGTLWIDIKNMSGRDVFLMVDTKATGKCELAEKKF